MDIEKLLENWITARWETDMRHWVTSLFDLTFAEPNR